MARNVSNRVSNRDNNKDNTCVESKLANSINVILL